MRDQRGDGVARSPSERPHSRSGFWRARLAAVVFLLTMTACLGAPRAQASVRQDQCRSSIPAATFPSAQDGDSIGCTVEMKESEPCRKHLICKYEVVGTVEAAYHPVREINGAEVGRVERAIVGEFKLGQGSLLAPSGDVLPLAASEKCDGVGRCDKKAGPARPLYTGDIAGFCQATAGAWKAGFSGPGNIYVSQCLLRVAEIKPCRPRVAQHAVAGAGRAQTRARTCRPHRKIIWFPHPPKPVPPPPPDRSGGGGSGGGGAGYWLTVTGEGVDYTTPDGRDLGRGSGYLTVTLPDGSTHRLGCPDTCAPGAGSWYLPAGSKVSIVATENRDSTFQSYDVSGSNAGCGGSRTCRLTLSADTTVDVKFGVKTWVLTVSNQDLNEGGVYQGSVASGIDCGLNEPSGVVNKCQAVERAYTRDLGVTVYAGRPAHDGNFYVFDNLDCGSGPPQDVEPHHITAQCYYSNTATDTTLTVSWKLDPSESGTA